jgi:gas vesicle protein
MVTNRKISISPLRNQIEDMIRTEKFKDVDIVQFAKDNGLDITPDDISKHRKKLYKSVIEKVQEKSKQLVDEIATERLNLADSVDDSIKKLNSILDNTPLEDIVPKNAKEYAALLQAKSNLVRAEIEAKGAAPTQALNIIKLIDKYEQKRRDELKVVTTN